MGMGSGSCVTCDIITAIETAALNLVQQMFEATGPAMATLLLAVAGLVLMVSLVKWALAGHPPHQEVIGLWIALSISGTLLSSYSTYSYWTIDIVRDFAAWYTGRELAATSGRTVDATGPNSLLGAAEAISGKAFDISKTIVTDNLGSPGALLAALLLIIPYLFNIVIFLGLKVFSSMMLLIPAALGPILIFCGCFKWGRKLMLAGIDFFISSSVTLIIATMWMAISQGAFVTYTQGFPSDISTWTLAVDSVSSVFWQSTSTSDFLWSRNYWVTVILGWLTSYFLAITPQMAGYFTGKVDSAANIGGAIMGSAARTLGSVAFFMRLKR